MSKVVCLGYFERGNAGDEAFKFAHEWMFGKENIEFAHGKLTEEFVAGRPVFMGGGDMVAPFFLDWIPRGVPFSMLGVGLKYENSSLKAMADKGQDLQFSWFRNHIDVDMAQAAGFAADYCPDIVFALRNAQVALPNATQAMLTKIGPNKPFAVVCLTDHFNSRFEFKEAKHNAYLEYFKWELAAGLDKLAEQMPIVFLPLSVYLQHQDARLHADVASRMKLGHRTHQISGALHPFEAISLIRRSSQVVSMKLHGSIFGLMTERPCVNIGVGRKQLTLYAEAGLEDCSVHPGELSVRSFEAAWRASNTPDALAKVTTLAHNSTQQLEQVRQDVRDMAGLPALG
jgi:polysaccharide pyruvyl transferase WcaK-like protein